MEINRAGRWIIGQGAGQYGQGAAPSEICLAGTLSIYLYAAIVFGPKCRLSPVYPGAIVFGPKYRLSPVYAGAIVFGPKYPLDVVLRRV